METGNLLANHLFEIKYIELMDLHKFYISYEHFEVTTYQRNGHFYNYIPVYNLEYIKNIPKITCEKDLVKYTKWLHECVNSLNRERGILYSEQYFYYIKFNENQIYGHLCYNNCAFNKALHKVNEIREEVEVSPTAAVRRIKHSIKIEEL